MALNMLGVLVMWELEVFKLVSRRSFKKNVNALHVL